MPEDKLYIFCDQPDAEYGFKEMIACISDEKLIESYGFTEAETAEIIAEAAKYKGRMVWFAKNQLCF